MGIFVKDEVKKVEIEFEGEIYEFEIKELTWSQQNSLISECTELSKSKKIKFDQEKYTRKCLLACVTKAPFDMTNANLMKLSRDFGKLLEKELITNVLGEISEVDEKNLETS